MNPVRSRENTLFTIQDGNYQCRLFVLRKLFVARRRTSNGVKTAKEKPALASAMAGKSAQDIQDSIFQKMSADQSVKLRFDFMAYGMRHSFKEGDPIPMRYLRRWLKKNTPKLSEFLV